MAEAFDPYLSWLGIRSPERPPNHYRLLGIEMFETSADVIATAADRQMAHVRTFQSGKQGELSQRVLNELAAARVCLLNPAKKQRYDELLRGSAARAAAEGVGVRASTAAASQPAASGRSSATVAEKPAGFAVDFRADGYKSARGRRKKQRTSLAPLVMGAIGIVVLAGAGLAYWNMAQPAPVAQSDSAPKAAAGANAKAKPSEEKSRSQQPTAQAVNPAGGADHATAPRTESLDEPPKRSDPVKEADSGVRVAQAIGPLKEKDKIRPKQLIEPSVEEPKETTTAKPQESEAPAAQASAMVGVEKRLPAPSADEIAAASKKIKSIFAKEFAGATTAERREELAQTLLKQGDEERDSTSQYALWDAARELALRAGKPSLAVDAAERLVMRFQLDRLHEVTETLVDGAKTTRDPAVATAIGLQMMETIDTAASAERFEEAIRLAQAAIVLANKIHSPESAKLVSARLKALQEQQKAFDAAATARETLASNPSDAEANLVLGRYLCLVKSDWKTGLPLLAKADDAGLAACAKQDAAEPKKPAEQVKLADSWFEYRKAAKSKLRDIASDRAKYWYEKAIPSLAGLEKTQAAKRVEELQSSSSSSRGPDELLSLRASFTMSSQWPERGQSPALLTGVGPLFDNNEFACHSGENDLGAHLTIDLHASASITRIEIENRRQAALFERFVGAGVWISSSPQQRGRQVATITSAEQIYNLRLPEPIRGRYITVGFPEKTPGFVCLFSVKIYGHK